MRLARKQSSRLDPSKLRLPLIALIDVVLFLLMYFLLAGSLEGAERTLDESLGSAGAAQGALADLQAQVLEVDSSEGKVIFRLAGRVLPTRAELLAALRPLPKEIGVVIRGTDSVSVAAIAAATQTCRDAGFDKVSYVPMRSARAG